VIVELFVPVLLNVFVQLDEDPVQAPDHEYVYEPVPPETLEIYVDDSPVSIELGLVWQETDKSGVDCVTATEQ